MNFSISYICFLSTTQNNEILMSIPSIWCNTLYMNNIEGNNQMLMSISSFRVI